MSVINKRKGASRQMMWCSARNVFMWLLGMGSSTGQATSQDRLDHCHKLQHLLMEVFLLGSSPFMPGCLQTDDPSTS